MTKSFSTVYHRKGRLQHGIRFLYNLYERESCLQNDIRFQSVTSKKSSPKWHKVYLQWVSSKKTSPKLHKPPSVRIIAKVVVKMAKRFVLLRMSYPKNDIRFLFSLYDRECRFRKDITGFCRACLRHGAIEGSGFPSVRTPVRQHLRPP